MTMWCAIAGRVAVVNSAAIVSPFVSVGRRRGRASRSASSVPVDALANGAMRRVVPYPFGGAKLLANGHAPDVPDVQNRVTDSVS